MPIVLLLILCASISFHVHSEPKMVLQQLDHTLELIDALEGYGPHESLEGLELYLQVLQDTLSKEGPDDDEKDLLEGILSKLFSRYAYRDGSYRSRIYAEAQKRAITLLCESPLGKELLEKHAEERPFIRPYIEVLS